MHTVQEAHPVRDEGTVVVFEGVDTDTGEIVWFAVDRRLAHEVAEVAAAGTPVAIESWQLLATTEVV